jgi:hypothetical protein
MTTGTAQSKHMARFKVLSGTCKGSIECRCKGLGLTLN